MNRVSNLRDEVLSHILSFLPIKEAALTSVLSKRWRNLFAFVPNLDFDDSAFLHPEEGKRERDGILQSFMDFVDRILALQGDSLIKKFSLKVKTGIDRDRVNCWICNVLQRGVADLDLFIEFGKENLLPLDMFLSKKLVKLRLSSNCRVHWCGGGEGTFILPMLKTLVIDRAQICRDKVDKFLLAFPVLEELYMAHFEWKDSDETVSSASLRKLTIFAFGCDDLLNPKSILFDIPSLLYLNYSDYVAEDYPKVNFTNLVEAVLNLMVTEDQLALIRAPNDEDDGYLRLRNVWKLMSGIRNVQKFFLSHNTIEVLSLRSASIPVFNNLRVLKIMSKKERGWQGMPVLLRNSPHLETLVFVGLLHYETDKCGDACDCIPREDKGRSLTSCPVRKIQIKGFLGTAKEMRLITHFLNYFPCLKKMEIHAEENSPTLLKDTEMFELIVIMFKLKDRLYTCDVKFLVRGSVYKEWTAQ